MSVRMRFTKIPRQGMEFDPLERRTKQAMRDECDINNIVKQFKRTGAIAHVARSPASYGFAEAMSFHDAMNRIVAAEQSFLELPSAVRKRFKNDVGSFLEFISDSKNVDEMVKLGLVEKVKEPPAAAPMKVEVVNKTESKPPQ